MWLPGIPLITFAPGNFDRLITLVLIGQEHIIKGAFVFMPATGLDGNILRL